VSVKVRTSFEVVMIWSFHSIRQLFIAEGPRVHRQSKDSAAVHLLAVNQSEDYRTREVLSEKSRYDKRFASPQNLYYHQPSSGKFPFSQRLPTYFYLIPEGNLRTALLAYMSTLSRGMRDDH
jgi:hypothetical protein